MNNPLPSHWFVQTTCSSPLTWLIEARISHSPPVPQWPLIHLLEYVDLYWNTHRKKEVKQINYVTFCTHNVPYISANKVHYKRKFEAYTSSHGQVNRSSLKCTMSPTNKLLYAWVNWKNPTCSFQVAPLYPSQSYYDIIPTKVVTLKNNGW